MFVCDLKLYVRSYRAIYSAQHISTINSHTEGVTEQDNHTQMVETRTKRLLEASVDNSDESGSENEADDTYNSQELADINMPDDNEEMVYLHKPKQYTPPKEFMSLVGGAQTFEKLMKCVESDGRSRMYIAVFQAGFKSEAEKDRLIQELQSNAYFFQSFVQATPTFKTAIGQSTLLNKVAVSRFQGNDRTDIKQLL